MKTLLIALLCAISFTCVAQKSKPDVEKIAKESAAKTDKQLKGKIDTLMATVLISPSVEKTMLARDKAIGEMQQKIKEFQELNQSDYNAAIEYYNISKAADSVSRNSIIETKYSPGKFVIKFKK